jgi:predicted metal-dependent enzyme (double-stranded beta helix superfamily)
MQSSLARISQIMNSPRNPFIFFGTQLKMQQSLAAARLMVEKLIVDEFVTSKIGFRNNTYQRYLLYADDFCAIFIIAWKARQETPLHGHPSNGCLFKVLRGSLTETKILKARDTNHSQTELIRTCTSVTGTSYIDNTLGVHKIQANVDSMSLHVYSPTIQTLDKEFVDLRSIWNPPTNRTGTTTDRTGPPTDRTGVI